MASVPFLVVIPDASNITVADAAIGLRITAERMISRGLTAIRQPAEVSQYRPGITMYEFPGATLQEAVHQALRYPALSTKKLAKVAAKFDFTARLRMGSVLFVGEGNLSFALTMSASRVFSPPRSWRQCTRQKKA